MKRKTTSLWIAKLNLMIFTFAFPLSSAKAYDPSPASFDWDSTESDPKSAPSVDSILRNRDQNPQKSFQQARDATQLSFPSSRDKEAKVPKQSALEDLLDISKPMTGAAFHSQEIAQNTPNGSDAVAPNGPPDAAPRTILINFNNVSIIEYIRFISRITNKNFVFDEADLQFNVTIISEEPATIENIMTALLQELRIHGLNMLEDGNNLIIHKNPKMNGISKVVTENAFGTNTNETELVTQVFRLNTLDPEKAASVLSPLVSEFALIEVIKDSNHIIITDLVSNVTKIAQLIKSIDAPNSGLVVGQYVSRLTAIDALVPVAQQIMEPISQGQILNFIPHTATNSIFIVSSPFLVERTIAIMQYLDQNQGETRILDMNDLRLNRTNLNQRPLIPGGQGGSGASFTPPQEILRTPSGQWSPNAAGNWTFKPETPTGQPTQQTNTPPQGSWSRDAGGNWTFTPGQSSGGGPVPPGQWTREANGNWIYELEAGQHFNPERLVREFQGRPGLPGGIEKKTKYYIHKLKYRKGDSLEKELRQIADTVQQNERGNEDLISALRSVQWLDVSSSLVLSGTPDALTKVREFIIELDVPIRQVLIEMLILQTTITDSLNYGVSYETLFGGGNTAGGQSFLAGASPLTGALATTGLNSVGQVIGATTGLPFVPSAAGLVSGSGFNLGVIGQKITHCGREFGTIGGLVNALHDRLIGDVIMNPKLLSEDGASAEIFVGINTPYRTQSISNDFGSVITSNYQYVDVGTTFKVTPYIGNGRIVTLDISEEVSSVVSGLITNATTASTSPGPTTNISRSTTRVHIPDGFFLIISGMMQDEATRDRAQVPCVGGIPILGAAFTSKVNSDSKRNLLIFIRPQIIDTEEQIQMVTKHQQDVYKIKMCEQNSMEYETVEALELFNIPKTLHPEDTYDCRCN